MATTIQITGERLAAMYDNEMGVYVTPGAEEHPYWDSRPNFMYDYSIGSVWTILDILSEQAGYEVDIDDLRDDETVYEVELETEMEA